MLLAFWQVIFYNELAKEALKGSLPWPAEDVNNLISVNRQRFLKGDSKLRQALTALFYIEDIAPTGKSSEETELDWKPFELPPLPQATEFGCKCQPAPS